MFNNFWKNIQIIQEALGIPDAQLAQTMLLSKEHYLKAKKLKQDISISSIDHFINEFDLSLELILGKKIKPDLLQDHFFNINSSVIPQEYLEPAYSAFFTFKNLLEISHFQNCHKRVLRTLQIGNNYSNAEIKTISIKAIHDSCSVMESSFHMDDFKFVGKLNAMELKDQEYGRVLKSSRNLPELFEKMLQVEGLIEKNWHYRIEKLNTSKIVINSYPNQELEEHYKRKDYFSHAVNSIRLGFCEAIPSYINQSNAKAQMLKSVLDNDSHCQFEIDFTSSKPLFQRLARKSLH